MKATLAHPWVRRIRAPLRSLWWGLRGLGAHNPPIPDRVESMLFVCLGNICRSPFGAEMAKRLVADARAGDIRCASAGIRPSQDGRSPREACRVSATYGISLEEHVPKGLTGEMMHSHDMVVVMEWRHLAELRRMYPDLRDRIFLLPLFDERARNAYERVNIADPFGRPLSAFEDCYARIDRALRLSIARMTNRRAS